MSRKSIGFIKPDYPGERRVALLPEDIVNFENDVFIEEGFGSLMGIDDSAYVEKGCKILSREQIFKQSDAIFSLKLLQASDYKYLDDGQMIIGWTHPFGSGKEFYENECVPRGIKIVDLDNITPRIFYKEQIIDIDYIPRNFIRKNSVVAGFAATYHALEAYGLWPTSATKIAILSSGNVAQGAFQAASIFNADIQMFYRKTMHEFKERISEFDVIINGIEVDQPNLYIISKEDLLSAKKNSLIIDAAADAGNAIYGTEFTTYEKPLMKLFNSFVYCINNSPSVFYRTASKNISKAFSKHVYSVSLDRLFKLVDSD